MNSTTSAIFSIYSIGNFTHNRQGHFLFDTLSFFLSYTRRITPPDINKLSAEPQ